MRSLKIFTHNHNGFTIVELLVVLGIVASVGSLGLFLNMDFYQGYSFNYEQNLFVSVIQRARSEAMANINQSKRGVCIIGSDYVISEGDICTDGDTFPKSSTVTVTWPVGITTLIFNQIDGSCTTCIVPVVITLAGPGKTSTITVNNEGQIDW